MYATWLILVWDMTHSRVLHDWQKCMHTYIYANIYLHIYIYVYTTYIHTYTQTHTYTHIYMYICEYILHAGALPEWKCTQMYIHVFMHWRYERVMYTYTLLQCVAVCCSMLQYVARMRWHESCVEVYYSVLHCVQKIENDNKIFLTYIRDMCSNALQCVEDMRRWRLIPGRGGAVVNSAVTNPSPPGEKEKGKRDRSKSLRRKIGNDCSCHQ